MSLFTFSPRRMKMYSMLTNRGRPSADQGCSGLCLDCEGTALNYAHVTKIHTPHTSICAGPGGRACSGGNSCCKWWPQKPRVLPGRLLGCHRSSGISVPSITWFCCPHTQPMYLWDFRPSLSFAPWANIYTSSVDMDSSNIQQDAQCIYFVQVQFSFRGDEKWNPRLINRQTQATQPANFIFPRLKHFSLCSCNYLLLCSFSLTSVLPSHPAIPSHHLQRTQRPPKTIKPNHKQAVWQ